MAATHERRNAGRSAGSRRCLPSLPLILLAVAIATGCGSSDPREPYEKARQEIEQAINARAPISSELRTGCLISDFEYEERVPVGDAIYCDMHGVSDEGERLLIRVYVSGFSPGKRCFTAEAYQVEVGGEAVAGGPSELAGRVPSVEDFLGATASWKACKASGTISSERKGRPKPQDFVSRDPTALEQSDLGVPAAVIGTAYSAPEKIQFDVASAMQEKLPAGANANVACQESEARPLSTRALGEVVCSIRVLPGNALPVTATYVVNPRGYVVSSRADSDGE